MTFVVNGADWKFDGLDAGQTAALIDRALVFVEVSSERGEEVVVGDDFQTRPMHGDRSLWELFTENGDLHLPREIAQELAGWLGRARRYADADEWPAGADDTNVAVGDAPATPNDDVAWVHHSVRAGLPAAVFALGGAGLVATTTAAGGAQVHFVGDEAGRRRFWRDRIVLGGDDMASLAANAAHAYPDLLFADGAIGGAGRLAGGYLASRNRVQTTFAALDDWGAWAFDCPPPAITPYEGAPPDPDARPTKQLLEHRFAGLGLDAAPENPNVRADATSRTARETEVGGRTLYCEWHAKLEPHRNRIHFHGPVPESGGRVVVGMIDEHLPLP